MQTVFYSLTISFIITAQIFSQIFLDVTESSQTEVTRHWSSFFGAGASFVDFNNDGYDDIIVPTTSGGAFKLFKNMTDNTFLDVSSSSGFENEDSESISVLVADYDNDGYDDFFIVNWAESSRLYRNNGDNTFVDVTDISGMNIPFISSRAACWLDYNRDGYIDLYMVNREVSEYNILYHNNGDGTFSDKTDFAGVNGTESKMGLVVAAFDYNNDLWPDIYIGNDFDTGNIFYHNNGDGTFTDRSVESGLDLEFSSMGIAVGDYDKDEDLDVYITNLDSGNALMRNNGNGTFTDVALDLGLQVNLISWGANFFDYDNDTNLDLYVAAGCISGTGVNAVTGELLGCSWNGGVSDVFPINNILYSNNGNGTFDDASEGSGLNSAYLTTGTAIGDFNNDGFYDIYEVNELDPHSSSSPCRLYQNNYDISGEIGSGIHKWIKVKLEGVQSNKNGIGSQIKVFPNNNTNKLIREVASGGSYSSQDSYTIIIGVRHSSIVDSLMISWPSGLVETYYDLNIEELYEFIEGASDSSDCINIIDRNNLMNGLDCLGICGGAAVEDCAGVCGGAAVEDACGICGGDGTSCADCAGVPNGTATEDLCGVCNGDNTTCSGCIYESAINYDPNATIDDGSCSFLMDIEGYEIPNNFAIVNTYPNPFNPIVSIDFSVPVFMNVLIQIFNIDGVLVQTLNNANLYPGYYSLDWNAKSNPSGIYFVKMTSSDNISIQKLTLMK